MNVIIANNYKDALSSLDIDVIKRLDGEFDVETIVETFANFYFNRMILDISALKDAFNIMTMQKLCSSLDASKIILYLSDDPRCNNQFLSRIISLGIYNFASDLAGVKYLIDNPNSYRDVAQYHDLAANDLNNVNAGGVKQNIFGGNNNVTNGFPTGNASGGFAVGMDTNSYTNSNVVLGFKSLTPGAGATSLIYMLKKHLKGKKVLAVEVNKNDFTLFNDGEMMSIGSNQIGTIKNKFSQFDVVLIDINNSTLDIDGTCTDVVYLLEPSIVKLNALLRKDRQALDKIKSGKIVLSKSLLTPSDVSEFEYEAKAKIFYNLPPLDDRKDNQEVLDDFLAKLGISNNGVDASPKGIFDIFKK